VLEWVFRRCDDEAGAAETPIGLVPTPEALDTDGLDIAPADLERLLHVDPEEWLAELEPIREFYAQFGDKLPPELTHALDALEQRLNAARG